MIDALIYWFGIVIGSLAILAIGDQLHMPMKWRVVWFVLYLLVWSLLSPSWKGSKR